MEKTSHCTRAMLKKVDFQALPSGDPPLPAQVPSPSPRQRHEDKKWKSQGPIPEPCRRRLISKRILKVLLFSISGSKRGSSSSSELIARARARTLSCQFDLELEPWLDNSSASQSQARAKGELKQEKTQNPRSKTRGSNTPRL